MTLTETFLISICCYLTKVFGSGALYGKMLLVRNIENNKMDVYFRAG